MTRRRAHAILQLVLPTCICVAFHGAVAAAAVSEWSAPPDWLLVSLEGACEPEPDREAVGRGLLGLLPPGPRVARASCAAANTQLEANVTLTVRDTLRLTHLLDRLRALNETVFVAGRPFAVCCYRRRQYQLRERRAPPARRSPAEAVVYAGVAGTCGFLVLGAALLAVVFLATRPRRQPPPPASATVNYSDAMLRRLDRPRPEVRDAPDEEPGSGDEEDVLLDMLSQPPQPRDAETTVAYRSSTEFY